MDTLFNIWYYSVLSLFTAGGLWLCYDFLKQSNEPYRTDDELFQKWKDDNWELFCRREKQGDNRWRRMHIQKGYSQSNMWYEYQKESDLKKLWEIERKMS